MKHFFSQQFSRLAGFSRKEELNQASKQYFLGECPEDSSHRTRCIDPLGCYVKRTHANDNVSLSSASGHSFQIVKFSPLLPPFYSQI